MRRLNHAIRYGLSSLLFLATASTGLSSTIFTNSTSISIPATTGGATLPVISDPYPSQIDVSGMVGTLTGISVVINGWTDTGVSHNPGDIFFMVVAPNGQGYEFLGGIGSNNLINNVNLTLTDSAPSALTSGIITMGSYKPTVLGSSCPAFPVPAPTSAPCAAPRGTDTFFSQFEDEGLNPNGTWSLYVMDNTAGDTASTISRGWGVLIDSTDGFEEAPEPSGLAMVGLAMGLCAFRRFLISRRLQ